MKAKSFLSVLVLGAIFASAPFSFALSEDAAAADVRAIPVKTPPPVYPDQLRRDGVSGTVAVKVLVDEEGNVVECSVTKSTRTEFEEAALNAIKGWKFKPASKAGAAVKSRFVIPITFNNAE